MFLHTHKLVWHVFWFAPKSTICVVTSLDNIARARSTTEINNQVVRFRQCFKITIEHKNIGCTLWNDEYSNVVDDSFKIFIGFYIYKAE